MASDHISVHCPHCGKHTAISPAPLAFEIVESRTRWDRTRKLVQASGSQDLPIYTLDGSRWWMGKCNACGMPMLVMNDGHQILPPPRPSPVDPNIPEPMQSDLLEAKQCVAVDAYNAAVVMARRALQCAAIERGAPKEKKLWEQIKWLEDNRIITAQQRQWADAARWVGNHGAHDTEPNVPAGQPVITEVTHDDAVETIELIEHLFETLYVASNKAHAQLAKRGKIKP